jgi:hypothetical protein
MAGKAAMGGNMGEVLDTGESVMNNVADAMTWSPKTQGAQSTMGAFGGAMETGMTGARHGLHAAENYTGIPGLALVGEIGAQAAAEFIPGKRALAARRSRLANVPDTSTAEKAARRLGIDLKNETIRDSVVEAGRTLSGDSSVSTSGIEAVTAKIIEEKKAAQAVVKQNYEDYRAKKTALPAEPFVALGEKLEAELMADGADFKADTTLTARINDLRNIRETIFGAPKGRDARSIPGQSSVILGADKRPLRGDADAPVPIPIQELSGLSSRVGDDIKKARASDPGLARHLTVVKKRIDDAIDQQFANDMMYGDASAKEAWYKARDSNKAMMARFGDDRTIVKLANEQLTATEISNLIFGASENGTKAGAIRVARKVKSIIGDDQAANDAMRAAIYAKLMEPLLGPEPNFRGFRTRLRKWQSRDGELLNLLGVSEADLTFMSRAAAVADKVKTVEMMNQKFDKTLLSSAIAKLSFGHEISQAGLRVKLANMFTDWAFGVGQKTHNQLLHEFSVDPDAALLQPKYPKLRWYAARAAATAEAQGRGDNNEEEDR